MSFGCFQYCPGNSCERLHSQILGHTSRLFTFSTVCRLKRPANERSKAIASDPADRESFQMFDAFFEVSTWPNIIVALDLKPSSCATSITSSHSSLLIFKRRNPLAYAVTRFRRHHPGLTQDRPFKLRNHFLAAASEMFPENAETRSD